jgi:CRP-like cAMP-binding protein
MNYPTTEQVAAQLESLARRIAPTIAALIALAVFTYNAGHALGVAVHEASAWLAHHWPTRPADAPAPAPLAEIIAETGAVVLVAPACEVRELRALGLSQRAIAERLGVSRATVRRRLAAAV